MPRHLSLDAEDRDALRLVDRGGALAVRKPVLTGLQAVGLVSKTLPIQLTSFGEEVVERS
jgi:hypothetical protein